LRPDNDNDHDNDHGNGNIRATDTRSSERTVPFSLMPNIGPGHGTVKTKLSRTGRRRALPSLHQVILLLTSEHA